MIASMISGAMFGDMEKLWPEIYDPSYNSTGRTIIVVHMHCATVMLASIIGTVNSNYEMVRDTNEC